MQLSSRVSCPPVILMILSIGICFILLLASSCVHPHSFLLDHNSDPHQAINSNSNDFKFILSHADDAEIKNFKAIKKHGCKSIEMLMEFQYAYQPHNPHKYRGWGGGAAPSQPPEFFSKHILLSHLRNKTFTIMGDSLGLQMFYSLDASLMSERSSFSHTLKRPKNKYHLFHGVCTYLGYNATLQYLSAPTYEEARPFFGSEYFLLTDVLLIVMGAWYKPGFPNSHSPTSSFPSNLTEASELYSSIIIELRATIAAAVQQRMQMPTAAAARPPLRVIWQLNTHTGPSDHHHYKLLANSSDGQFWDQFSHEAQWVLVYNAAIRRVAHAYRDWVLDTYTISKQLLRHVNALRTSPPTLSQVVYPNFNYSSESFHLSSASASSVPAGQVQVHSDALHYCQGGVFRAAAFLLQKLWPPLPTTSV